MGQNPRVKANKIAPVCPDPGNVLTHAGALGHASNGCSGEHCVWHSKELRLVPYYVDALDTDAKVTKAGGFITPWNDTENGVSRPSKIFFDFLYPRFWTCAKPFSAEIKATVPGPRQCRSACRS